MGSRDYMVYPSKKKDIGPMQTELGRQTKVCTDNIGSTFLIAANEPSQALYRIQEHIRKSVPKLVERRLVSEDANKQVKGAIFDVEYAIDACAMTQKSLGTFKSINDSLKNAIHLAQQIKHLQTVSHSMYQHTQ